MTKPSPVFNKSFQWKRSTRLYFRCVFVRFQCECAVRIGEVRSDSRGTKEHPLRHLRCPKLHGLSKDTNAHPACLQVGCRGKTVRTSSDDGNIATESDGCCAAASTRLSNHSSSVSVIHDRLNLITSCHKRIRLRLS